MSNINSICQGVRGLPKIRGFPLTLNVALTTVLRTNVLAHCDAPNSTLDGAVNVCCVPSS